MSQVLFVPRGEHALQVYRRLAKFDKATGNGEVTLSFDARGSIAGFNIGSIGRQD